MTTLLKYNTAEGVSSGTTALGGANTSSSGNAFGGLTPTGATVTFDNTHAAFGSNGFKFTAGSGGAANHTSATLTAQKAISCRFYLYVPASTGWSPLADGVGIVCWQTAVTTRVARLVFSSTGQVKIQQANGTVVYTSTQTLATDQWYCVEFDANVTASIARARVFKHTTTGQTLVVDSGDVAGSYGTVGTTQVDFGGINGNTVTTSSVFWLDAYVINYGGFGVPLIGQASPGWRVRVRHGWGVDPSVVPGNWTLYDDTKDLLQDDDSSAITITRGRPDETAQPPAATCNYTLRNGVQSRYGAGTYTKRNPLSHYYPYVKEGVPSEVFVIDYNGGEYERFTGFIDDLTPNIDGSGDYSMVPISAKGALNRLQLGKQPLKSPLTRLISTLPVVEYWPCEDMNLAVGNTSAANIDPHGPKMQATPTDQFSSAGALPAPSFGSSGTGSGSASVVEANDDGGLYSTVRMRSNNGYQIGILYRAEKTADGAQRQLMQWTTSTGWRFSLQLFDNTSASSFTQFSITMENDSSGLFDTMTVTGGPRAPFDGQWHYYMVQVSQSGSFLFFNVLIDGLGGPTYTTGTAISIGNVSRIFAGGNGYADPAHSDEFQFGQVVIIADAVDYTIDAAVDGYSGQEFAGDRFARLCYENGVPWTYDTKGVTVMGSQTVDSLPTLLASVSTTDLGVIEDSVNYGLKFWSQDGRLTNYQNGVVGITMPIGAFVPPFYPTQNTQFLRNEWDVYDAVGNTANYSQPAGEPYAVAGAGGVGEYSDSATLTVPDPLYLPYAAQWRVHLGSVDADRFNSLPIKFTRTAAIPYILTWLLKGAVSTRLAVTGTYSTLSPQPIDLVIEGWTERLGPNVWDVDLNTSPGQGYRTNKLDDTVLATLDTDGSALVSAWNGSSTGAVLLVSTVNVDSPKWSVNGADYAQDWNLAGQRVTVSAVASSITDAFTRSTSNGWGTPTTTPGAVWTPQVSSSAFATSGTQATITPGATTLRAITIDTLATTFEAKIRIAAQSTPVGGQCETGFVFAYQDASNFYSAYVTNSTSAVLTAVIGKLVAGSFTTLTSQVLTGVTLASDVILRLKYSAATDSMSLKVWQNGAVEPAYTTLTASDSTFTGSLVGCFGYRDGSSPTVHTFDDFELVNPQTATVSVASVNGVAKTAPAGTDVRVWFPFVLSWE